MKKAVMFSVPSAHQNGYVWRWRCVDTDAESEDAFAMYHDCFADAQKRGYQVEVTRAAGLTAPGGAPHALV